MKRFHRLNNTRTCGDKQEKRSKKTTRDGSACIEKEMPDIVLICALDRRP